MKIEPLNQSQSINLIDDQEAQVFKAGLVVLKNGQNDSQAILKYLYVVGKV